MRKILILILLSLCFFSFSFAGRHDEDKRTPRQILQALRRQKPILSLSLEEHARLNNFISGMVAELYPELALHLEIHVHILDEVKSNATIFTGDLRKIVDSQELREIHIFLSKGLICELPTQGEPIVRATTEELRFIIAHEIGHLDSVYKMSWATGQLQELEADNRATFASIRAGFDPESGIDFFRRRLKLNDPEKEDSPIDAAFKSHPPTTERIYAMQGYLTQLRKAQGVQFAGEKRETQLPEWLNTLKDRRFVHPYMQDMIADGYDPANPEKALAIFEKHYFYKKHIGLLVDQINFNSYEDLYFEFLQYLIKHIDSVSQEFIDGFFNFGLEFLHADKHFKLFAELFEKFGLPSHLKQARDTILDERMMGLKELLENVYWWQYFSILILLKEFEPLFENIDTVLTTLHRLQSNTSFSPQQRYYIRKFAIELIGEAEDRQLMSALGKFPLFVNVESYEELNDMQLKLAKWTSETSYMLEFRNNQPLALLHKPIADFINRELAQGGSQKEKAIQFMEERIYLQMSGKYSTPTWGGFSQSEEKVFEEGVVQRFHQVELLSYPIVGEPILLENPSLIFNANIRFETTRVARSSRDHEVRFREIHPRMTVAGYSVLARLDELGRVDLIEMALSDLEGFQPSPAKNIMDLIWGGNFILGGKSESAVLHAAGLAFFKNAKNLTSEQKIKLFELFFPTVAVNAEFFDMYREAADFSGWSVGELYQEMRRANTESRKFGSDALEKQNRPTYSHLSWIGGAVANELGRRFKETPSCLSADQIYFILRSTRYTARIDEAPFVDFFSRVENFPREPMHKIKLWSILSTRGILTRRVKDQVLDNIITELRILQKNNPFKAIKCSFRLLGGDGIDRDSKCVEVGKVLIDSWVSLYGWDNQSQEYLEKASRFLKIVSGKFTRGSDSRHEMLCYFANQTVSQRELSYKIRSYVDSSHYLKREARNEGAIEARIVSGLYQAIKRADEKDRKDFLLWLIDQKPLTLKLAKNIKVYVNRIDSKAAFSFKESMNIFKEFFWSRRLEQRAVLTAVAIEPHAEKIPSSHPTFQWVLDLAFEGSADAEVTRVVKSLLTVYYEALPDFEKNFFLGGLLTASRNKTGGIGEALSSFFGAMGPAGAKLAQSAHTMLVGIISEEDRAKLAKHKNLFSPPERWDIFEMIDQILPKNMREKIVYVDALLGSASIKIVVEIEIASGERYALNIVRPYTAQRAESEFYILEKAARDMVEREGSSYQIIVDMIVRARQKIEQEVEQSLERNNLELAEKAYADRGFKYIAIETVPLGPSDMQGEFFTVTKLIQGKTIDDIADRRTKCDVAQAIVETELDLILGGTTPIDLDRHFGNFLFFEETSTIVHLDFGQLRKSIPALTITRFIDLNRALAADSSYKAANILKLFDQSSTATLDDVQTKIEEHMQNNGGWERLSLTQRLIYTLSAMRAAGLTAPEDLLDLNTALGKLAEYQVYFDDPGEFARILEKKGFYYRLRNAPRSFAQGIMERVYSFIGYKPISDDNVPERKARGGKTNVIELFPRSEDGTLPTNSHDSKERMMQRMVEGLRRAQAREGISRMTGEAAFMEGEERESDSSNRIKRWLRGSHTVRSKTSHRQ